MLTTLTAADTEPLVHLADHVALRLCRKTGLSLQEREDFRQDLLLNLLARVRFYDPTRGSIVGFATVVFWHRADRLADRIRLQQKCRSPTSLDAPLCGTENLTLADTLADTLSDADSYGAWMGQPTDALTATERRLDLDRALSTLPSTSLPLCYALTEHTPHELAEAGHTPRTSLYRQIHAIRLSLLAAGVAPTWNGSAPAWVEV